MDKTKRNVAALGALTVLAIGIFFWGLYYLLGNSILQRGMDVYVSMPNAGGLKRGDRVLLQGVIVGSVRDMELRPREGVVAALRLTQKLDLPADTRATIAGDVFGAHTISLEPGSALVHLEKGDTLKGELTPQLMDQAAGLTGTARNVLSHADSLLSAEAISNLHATAAALPGSARELNATLSEMRLASAALRRTAEELRDAKTGAALNAAITRIDQGAQSISTAAQSLNTSIASLQSVFSKIDRGEGTLGRLVNDTSLYSELHGAAHEFRALAADIKANPKRYVDLRLF
jgi:phospholipid/cholesterol/gamma-HCH transport system substrate-binding protein